MATKKMKKMTMEEITHKVKELKEMEEILKDAQAAVDAIKEELKDEMNKRNTEELKVGRYIIRWTSVTSNRLDTTKFKDALLDLYKMYTKEVSSKRFTISD